MFIWIMMLTQWSRGKTLTEEGVAVNSACNQLLALNEAELGFTREIARIHSFRFKVMVCVCVCTRTQIHNCNLSP